MYLTYSETGHNEAHLLTKQNADFDGNVLIPRYRYHIKGKRRGLGKRGNRIQIVVLSGWLIYPVLKSIGERLGDILVGKE